jgi:hypothetical protein
MQKKDSAENPGAENRVADSSDPETLPIVLSAEEL